MLRQLSPQLGCLRIGGRPTVGVLDMPSVLSAPESWASDDVVGRNRSRRHNQCTVSI
jgi:hypothetical protein